MNGTRQLRNAIFGALALFVGALLALTTYTIFNLHTKAVNQGLDVAELHTRSYEDFLTQSLRVTEQATANAVTQETGLREVHSIERGFATVLRHTPFVRSLSLLDDAGRIVASSNPVNVGKTVATDAYLPTTGAVGILRIGRPWSGRDFSGGWTSTTDKPVEAEASFVPVVQTLVAGSRTVRVLMALNPDFFSNHASQAIDIAEGHVEILRFDGTLLMNTDPSARPGTQHDYVLSKLKLNEPESGRFEQNDDDEGQALTAYRASSLYPLIVVTHLDRKQALQPWRAESAALLGVVIPTLLVISLLACLFYRRLLLHAALRDTAQRARQISATVFDTSAEAITITDTNANIISVNAAFTRITGYSLAEVVGRNPRLLTSGLQGKPFYERLWSDLLQHGAWQGELINRHKDGRLFDAHVSITASRDARGQIEHFIGITADITERKRAETALRQSEDRFRHLTELSSDWYWEQDEHYRFVRIDGNLEARTGMSAASYIGRTRWDTPALNLTDADWAAHRAVLDAHLPFHHLEIQRANPCGPTQWTSISGVPLFNNKREFTGYRGVGSNITDHKAAEEARFEVLNRLHKIASRVPGVLYQFLLRPDGSSCFPYISEAVRTTYSVPIDPEDVREDGSKLFDQIHPRDLGDVIATIQTSAKDLTPWLQEYRIKSSDGVVRWLQGNAVPERLEDGSTLWFGFISDITERRRTQAEALHSALLLRTAIDTIDEAFVLYGPDDRLVLCNDKYRSLYALSSDLIVAGARFEDIIRTGAQRGQYTEAVGRVEEWVAERMASHGTAQVPLVQKLDDGRVLRIVERKMPDGSIVGFRSDITDLVRATEEAQAANLAKSRFLATMSHEIRTPMNGILGMAQLLLMPDISEHERDDFARTILTSGQSLMLLLNDILDLSKIEAGKIELEISAFEPEQIMRETLTLFASAAKGKKLQLDSVWHGPRGQRYLSDAHRLRQMLSNLVGNALKFTAHGFVHVDATEIERDDNSALLEFSVRDSGMGIAANQLGLLFKPFSQANNSTTREFGGSGLGLSIVKTMAQLAGGDVGVESELGRGARFWFRIRAGRVLAGENSRQSERPLPVAPALPSPGRHLKGHILVAEDNQVNALVISGMLVKLGLTLTLVQDGQQVLDAVMRGDAMDLVLMDLHMPVMDGYTATERIRQWESENEKPRRLIIALTADAFTEDRHHCLTVGMDDFLAKPLDQQALLLALTRWLPQPITPPADSPVPTVTLRQVDPARYAELVADITPLLVQNKFDALARFKALQALTADSELAPEMDEIEALLREFKFDLALARLRATVEPSTTSSST